MIMTAGEGVVDGVVIKHLQALRFRGLRNWTVYNRERALVRLHVWAESPILHLSEPQLLDWQRQRSVQIQPEPLRTEMSHHRGFYRWCVREGLRGDDPTARLELPRVPRHIPRPIGDRALAEAMAGAERELRAILALAAFAGLRACEIANLDWSEIDTGDRYPSLRVTEGKGGHSRIVPLSAALVAVLNELTHRRGPVIPRRDGQAGRNRSHRISQLANDYLHRAGIRETLHQCRHRFGTATYQACQDIRAVQDLLGHASPTTTAIYAAAASNVARAAVEAAGRFG